MDRDQPARYVRRAGPANGLKCTLANVNPLSGFGSEVPRICTVTIGDQEISVLPKAPLTGTSRRRRRRTESLPGRRQASRAPSGTVRQPIKTSAAPRNLPGN
ncbi:unnamed protein product [Allacma fusca]|uniref:Uncharacterized protein n=1 Tax=Allacma fusca TaxID=39272 RepID=A0A8J2L446_9HEXA|nr:unnamed protein product [Allacma fusca]